MGNGVKLLHTSDWHLGKQLHDQPLYAEQAAALKQIEEAMDEHDALLIAGDIFDRAVPNVDAVDMFSEFVNKMVEKGKPVIIIAGNHDSPQRLGYVDRTLEKKGIHVRCGYNRLTEPIPIHSQDGDEVDVFALPFIESLKVGEVLGMPEINDHAKATAAAVEIIKASKRPGIPAVLVAHSFVAGEFESSDSERVLFIGNQGRVPIETFDGFDYVALGHLHKRQSTGDNNIINYSGAIYPYSFSEVNKPKYMISVTLANGTVDLREIELHPLRKVTKIKGTIEELLGDAKYDSIKDDYISAELTNSQVVMNSQSKLKVKFPFILDISQAAVISAVAPIEAAKIADAADSPEKMFELFVENRGYTVEDAKKASAIFKEVMSEIAQSEREG